MIKKILYIALLVCIIIFALCDIVNTFYFSINGGYLFWIVPWVTILLFFVVIVILRFEKKIKNKLYLNLCDVITFLVFANLALSFLFLIPRGMDINRQKELNEPTHICSGYVTNKKRGHIIEYSLNGEMRHYYQFNIKNNYENSCHLLKINEIYSNTGETIDDYPSYLQELYCFDGVPYSKLNKIKNLKVVEKGFLGTISNKKVWNNTRFISCVVFKELNNICFYEALQSDKYIWASYNSRLHEGDSVLIKFSTENVAFFNIYKEKPTKEEYDMCLNNEGVSLSDSLNFSCPVKYQLKSKFIKIEIEKTSNDISIADIFGSRYREFIIPEIELDSFCH